MTGLRERIESLFADWAWHIDHGEFDELAGLFTEDAKLYVGGRIAEGRAAIKDRYASRTGTRTTRHMVSGIRIAATCDDSAQVTSTWICYASNLAEPADDLGAYLVADFHDTVRRDPDGVWRICRRRIVGVLRDPSRAPVSR